MQFPRINKPGTKHLYNLGVEHMNSGKKGYVEVEATNRNQATSIAEKAGYMVGDCNMIG